MRINAEGSSIRNQPATSYYDLYPERKRTGPYTPKHTLIAQAGNPPKESRSSSESSQSPMRRSRSGGQLKSLPAVPAGTAHASHSNASLRLPRPIDKDINYSGPEPKGIARTTALTEQQRLGHAH